MKDTNRQDRFERYERTLNKIKQATKPVAAANYAWAHFAGHTRNDRVVKAIYMLNEAGRADAIDHLPGGE